MTGRGIALITVLLAAAVPFGTAHAQQPEVQRAKAAYDRLDVFGAIQAAHRALGGRLSAADRIAALQILAYAYAVADSQVAAVNAFKQLIFLDPNREPDVDKVSPKITSLYASALGQVLVVRKMAVESASFVAGEGSAPIHFEVSRNARVVTHVVGNGLDVPVDSELASGPVDVRWSALKGDGTPLPAGNYQVIVTATEGQNQYSQPVDVRVRRGAVDTVRHLDSLPGYSYQPEYVAPPRNWQPLGLSVLFSGLTAGASLALENTTLGGGKRSEVGAVSALALVTGLVLSIRKPDPQPVEANIRYNALLRQQLAQQNKLIAEQNAKRRQEVQLTIVPDAGGGGGA